MLGRIADGLLVAQLCSNLAVAVLYACDRQWWKGVYWVAGAVIVLAVLKMKG